MYSMDVARKRTEAAEFRHAALMVSLQRDHEWCLRRAESLEREAEGLETLVSDARVPAPTVSWTSNVSDDRHHLLESGKPLPRQR